jgi:hypothetical protein
MGQCGPVLGLRGRAHRSSRLPEEIPSIQPQLLSHDEFLTPDSIRTDCIARLLLSKDRPRGTLNLLALGNGFRLTCVTIPDTSDIPHFP